MASPDELRDRARALKLRATAQRFKDTAAQRASIRPRPVIPDRDLSENLREFNVGVAQTMGLPVDMMGALARQSGLTGTLDFLGLSEEAIPGAGGEQLGGAQSLQQAFADIGAAKAPGEEGQDFVARLLRNAGGVALPVLGSASRAKGPLQAGGRVAAEGVSTFSATMAGEVARDASGDNVAIQAVAELLGGLTPSLAAGLVGRTGTGIRDTATDIARGGQVRADRRVQDLSADPRQAALDIEGGDILEGLPAADRTSEPRLVQMQNAIADAHPDIAHNLDVARSDVMKRGRALLSFGGSTDDFINYLDRLATVTAVTAQKRLTRLGPRVSGRAQRASQEVKGVVDDALDFATKAEVKVWKDVDSGLRIRLGNTLKRYGQTMSGRVDMEAAGVKNPREIPIFVRTALGSIDESGKFVPGALGFETDMGKVKAFRSRLLKELRDERKRPDASGEKLSILGDIAEGLIDDADLVDGGESLRKASGVSRKVHDTYRKGAVGRLQGFSAEGGQAVDPALSLDDVLSAKGNRQNLATKQLLDAAPESREAVEEFIKTSFVMQVTEELSNGVVGPINANRARAFIRRNSGALEELPELKKQLTNAIGSQQRVDELLGVKLPDTMTPLKKAKAAAGLVLDGNPNRAIDRVLKTGEPGMMRSLANTVRKDPEALTGLKAAFGEELLRLGETSGRDLLDERVFSGIKMRNKFNDLRPMAKELYTKDEMKRIDQVINTFEKLDRSKRFGRLPGPLMTDKPSKMISMFSRMVAARVGGKIGAESPGGSLQMAQMASGEAKATLQNLTVEDAESILVAMFSSPDGAELAKALTRDLVTATPKQVRSAMDLVKPFMVIPARTAIEAEQADTDASDEISTIRETLGVQF